LETFVAHLQLDAIRRAVSCQKDGLGPYVFDPSCAHGAGGVQLGNYVRIVDKVAKNGQRPLPRQPHCQINRVADAEAHAEMLGGTDLHGMLLSSDSSGVKGQW